jgi:hypothetical protein
VPLGLVRVLAAVSEPDRQRELARLAAEWGLTLTELAGLVERGRALGAGGGGRRGERGGGVAPREPDSAAGPERAAALRLLAGHPERTVSFARLFKIVDALCCACGVHEARPDACRQCPVPKLITLVERFGARDGLRG